MELGSSSRSTFFSTARGISVSQESSAGGDALQHGKYDLFLQSPRFSDDVTRNRHVSVGNVLFMRLQPASATPQIDNCTQHAV